MSALRDLHRRLNSRSNEDLLNRETSADDYSIEESGANIQGNKNLEKEDLNNDSIALKKEIASKSNQLKDENQSQPEPLIKKTEIDLGKQKNGWSNKKKALIFGGSAVGLILILVLGSVSYIKYIQNSFKQENVVIDFQGNKEVRSGEILAKKLVVNNNNRVSLETAKIKVFYPEELKPIYTTFMEEGPSNSFYVDMGVLDKFEIKEYEIQFQAYSGFGNEVYLQTELTYQPDNFSSNFNKKDSHLISIKGSVISFSLVSSNEAASGELLKFIGILNNNSDRDADNLVLEVDYPKSFQFEDSGLERFGDSKNRFRIPKLEAGEKREVEILGSFIGEVNSIENLKARLGTIKEETFWEIVSAEGVVKIIPSRITLEQRVLGGLENDETITETGNALRYEIIFKNNSSSPLTNLVLKEELRGDLIDQNSIESNNGYYDKGKQELIWKASDVPALKNLNPGESGSVEFKLAVRENFIPEIDRNQIVITKAKISSPNIDTAILSNQEINSGEKIVKIKTNLNVAISGKADDSVFNNQGPIPMEIGQETTFTLKVELKNTFNRIRKPVIVVKLPSGIAWKDSFQRSSGEVAFNERTNELTWRLDNLNTRVGYQKSAEELLFQIGITPQNDQSVRNTTLVNEILLTGYEEFVEKDISLKNSKFELKEIEDYEF